MDDILKIIKGRRSVRSFDSKKKISKTQIEKILEAGRWAPSAGNVQDWQFIVVRNEEIKGKLAEAALGQEFVAEAPVVIAIATDLEKIGFAYGSRGRELYAYQGTAAAVQNMFLTAHSMGLGVCWVGAFHDKKVAEALNLESHLRPVALLPLGYPKGKKAISDREDLDLVTRWMD